VEGGGFVVRRPFPVRGLSYVDPFLLVDEMGPVDYAPGKAVGAPDHPHRGFETVTYLIEGGMQHADSEGHRGVLRPGDVQWMTAGAGVVHSELPAPELLERGGRMHGFQIWVNLPRALKFTRPRYQEYASAQLPVVTSEGRWIKLIAGALEGARSPIETTVPTTVLHLKLEPGIAQTIPLAPGSNVVVHAIAGSGFAAGRAVAAHEVAIVSESPAALDIRTSGQPFEALVLAGVPLNEPVARYGPFVMNTMDEVRQAVEDFRTLA
jgi:redox-sensitive bicupin YhaK (pirin superfamily)